MKAGLCLSSWEVGISLSSSRSKPMMDQLSRPTKNLIQSDWWCNMLEQWISLQVMKESLYLMLYCIKVLIPLNRAMKMMITQVPNLEDSMPYSLNNLWIEDGAIDSSLTVNCHFKSPRNCKMPIKIWSQPIPFCLRKSSWRDSGYMSSWSSIDLERWIDNRPSHNSWNKCISTEYFRCRQYNCCLSRWKASEWFGCWSSCQTLSQQVFQLCQHIREKLEIWCWLKSII